MKRDPSRLPLGPAGLDDTSATPSPPAAADAAPADIGPATGLRALGVSADEERAYRALLRSPGLTTRQLAARLRAPAARVADAVAGLRHKCFVSHAPGGSARLLPAPPDIAVESLLLLRQRELQLARLAIPALEREQPHAAENPSIVEVIGTDPDARALPYAQSHQRATREVLCLVRPPFVVSSPRKVEQERAAARARGVRYRNIVHPDTLACRDWSEMIRQGLEAGEEVRLLAQVPFKMIISDRDMGLLPLQADQPDGPMLLLRGSAVMAALCDLFERLWAIALPIAFNAEGEVAVASAATYPPQLEPLVPLLASGANDKLIAERLGMSERTLMRRIDALYRALDARSRFQAGWLAAMRTYGLRGSGG